MKPSVDRLLTRMQAAEQRMRREQPGLKPGVGTEPPAIAFARPPAVPEAAPGAPAAAPTPAHGNH
jgi:hypothetical protein